MAKNYTLTEVNQLIKNAEEELINFKAAGDLNNKYVQEAINNDLSNLYSLRNELIERSNEL